MYIIVLYLSLLRTHIFQCMEFLWLSLCSFSITATTASPSKSKNFSLLLIYCSHRIANGFSCYLGPSANVMFFFPHIFSSQQSILKSKGNIGLFFFSSCWAWEICLHSIGWGNLKSWNVFSSAQASKSTGKSERRFVLMLSAEFCSISDKIETFNSRVSEARVTLSILISLS